MAAYVYSEDRKNERPAGHLAEFRGVLRVDGYDGFKRLAEGRSDASVTLAFYHQLGVAITSGLRWRLRSASSGGYARPVQFKLGLHESTEHPLDSTRGGFIFARQT
jgi:hypothetical protein